jgi:hypothetical protein
MSYHPEKWFGKRLYKCIGETDHKLTAQKWSINSELKGYFVRTLKRKSKSGGTIYLVYISRKMKLSDFKKGK